MYLYVYFNLSDTIASTILAEMQKVADMADVVRLPNPLYEYEVSVGESEYGRYIHAYLFLQNMFIILCYIFPEMIYTIVSYALHLFVVISTMINVYGHKCLSMTFHVFSCELDNVFHICLSINIFVHI